MCVCLCLSVTALLSKYPCSFLLRHFSSFQYQIAVKESFLNGTLIYVMVCSSAPLLCPLCLLQPFILLPHCIIMTRSPLSFLFLVLLRECVSDSLMRSAFPLNRQKDRMHQLLPTYNQHAHLQMGKILYVCLKITNHSND